jgi:hypothetical protein
MSGTNETVLPPVYVGALGSVDWSATKDSDPVIAVIKDIGDDEKGRALTTLMDDAKNKKLMQGHISKLAEETLTVRQAFQDIANLLIEFDSKQYSDGNGNKIASQRDGWKQLADVRTTLNTGSIR